jgi:hypothetical protein
MAYPRNGYWMKDDNGNLVASGVRSFQLGSCLGADVVLLLLHLDEGSVQVALPSEFASKLAEGLIAASEEAETTMAEMPKPLLH